MSRMDTDPVAARRDYEASVELVAQGASDVVHANTEASLALLCVNASDMQGTITHARAAIELFDATGDRPPAAGPLIIVARLLVNLGRMEAAMTILGALLDGCYAEMGLLAMSTFDDEVLGVIIAALPADKVAVARSRGAGMSIEELFGFALGELDTLVAGD
jgi:hypothetical protein